MRLREKIFVVLFIVTVLLGTVITAELAGHGASGSRSGWLLANHLPISVSDSLTIIINRMRAVLDGTSLWYGGISLLALMMIGLALRLGRDAELKALRFKVNTLEERLSETAAHKERAEKSLRSERNKNDDLIQEKVAALQEVEESFRRIHRLTTDLREKQEVLKTRDGEVRALRSELDGLRARLEETTSANERAEKRLREELRKNTEVALPNERATRAVQTNLNRSVQRLKTQLIESQEMLKIREAELETLRSHANSLTGELAGISTAKERAESLFQEELTRRDELLAEKDAAIRDLEERLGRELNALETAAREKQQLLKARDRDLEALRSEVATLAEQLSELTAAKKQADSLYQGELAKNNELLQEKESSLRVLEQTLGGRLRVLESRLSEKDDQLKIREAEVETLRSEVNSLSERLSETAFAKQRAEKFLQTELRKNQDLVQEKESAVKRVEASFGTRLRALEDELGEKQQLLKSREEELETLRSEIRDLARQLAGTASDKDRAESLLQEEIRKLIQEKEAVARDLEIGLRTIQSLETDLSEKLKLLDSRDSELKALRSEMSGLTARLEDIESDKDRAEKSLEEEVRQKQELLSNGAATRKLVRDLNARLNIVENELEKNQKLLAERDQELATVRSESNALMPQLAELASAKERLEILLQDERGKNEGLLEKSASAIKELEETLGGRADALQSQLNEQNALLEGREKELQALRSEIATLGEQLAASQSARARPEQLLEEELRKIAEFVPLNATAANELDDGLNATIQSLQHQLNEKQEALRKRDNEIESLVSELREKKILLAREEIADLQSVRRRNAWKRRLARLGIPTKLD